MDLGAELMEKGVIIAKAGIGSHRHDNWLAVSARPAAALIPVADQQSPAVIEQGRVRCRDRLPEEVDQRLRLEPFTVGVNVALACRSAERRQSGDFLG
jgi:hypothetical protein